MLKLGAESSGFGIVPLIFQVNQRVVSRAASEQGSWNAPVMSACLQQDSSGPSEASTQGIVTGVK